MGDVIWTDARRWRPGVANRRIDQAVAMCVRLSRKGQVSIQELSDELCMSRRSVYRWVNAFAWVMDIRIEGGNVIIESDIICR